VKGESIELAWSGERTSAKLVFAPGNADAMSRLEWNDGSADHSSSDLLADPPQID
jgi:sucrose phosphorylase